MGSSTLLFFRGRVLPGLRALGQFPTLVGVTVGAALLVASPLPVHLSTFVLVSSDAPVPATTITLSTNPEGPVAADTSVTLIAKLSPPTAVGTVSFLANGRLLGSDSPYRIEASWQTTYLVAGSYHLTSTFTPSNQTGTSSTSNVVALVVGSGVSIASPTPTPTPTPTRTVSPTATASTSNTPTSASTSASTSGSASGSTSASASTVVGTSVGASAPPSVTTRVARTTTPAASPTQSTAVLGETFVSPHGGRLPFTGLDLIRLIAAAIVAVGGGAMLVAAGRRVRRRSL